MGTKREHAAGNVIRGPWSAPAPTGADESEQQRLAQEIADQIVAGQGSVVGSAPARSTAHLLSRDVQPRYGRRFADFPTGM
jgi:hypothetical protein